LLREGLIPSLETVPESTGSKKGTDKRTPKL
jgi:hypothetical protein